MTRLSSAFVVWSLLTAMLSAGTILGFPTAAVATASTSSLGPVLDVAHRGASLQAPEGTLAALDLAVADDADRQSLDLQLTSDGVPVVMHDGDLTRTTDVETRFPGAASYAVRDFSLAQIKTLDAGSWFGDGAFTGSRVPTLDEALDELAASSVGLLLEVKNPELDGGVSGVGAAVMSVLGRHPGWTADAGTPAPRLLVESFSWDFLDGMKAAYRDLPLVLLGPVTAEAMDAHPYTREIDVRQALATPELVNAAHTRGQQVGVWTVNDQADIQASLARGVDRITGDDPRLVRTLLTSTGSSTPTARPQDSAATRVGLAVAPTVPLDQRTTIHLSLSAFDGEPVRWRLVVVESLRSGKWQPVATSASGPQGTVDVAPRVTDGLALRARADGAASSVATPTVHVAAVTLPAGASAPSLTVAAQARTDQAGVAPQVEAVPASVWTAMLGRSWRSGCPVGRAGLRLLRVSYWGVDGLRHRGALVVASRVAGPLTRVLRRLYALRQPIRSLHRVESMGTWGTAIGRSLRSDASYAFSCQRAPGEPVEASTGGSHARGTTVSLSLWENPTRVPTAGVANRWWATPHAGTPLVSTSGSATVAAFRAEGFAWGGSTGRPAEFRYTR